jgi:hypothetical protein
MMGRWWVALAAMVVRRPALVSRALARWQGAEDGW